MLRKAILRNKSISKKKESLGKMFLEGTNNYRQKIRLRRPEKERIKAVAKMLFSVEKELINRNIKSSFYLIRGKQTTFYVKRELSKILGFLRIS